MEHILQLLLLLLNMFR